MALSSTHAISQTFEQFSPSLTTPYVDQLNIMRINVLNEKQYVLIFSIVYVIMHHCLTGLTGSINVINSKELHQHAFGIQGHAVSVIQASSIDGCALKVAG